MAFSFPHNDKNRIVPFTYDELITEDNTKFIWKATTEHQQKIVVKIAQTYNVWIYVIGIVLALEFAFQLKYLGLDGDLDFRYGGSIDLYCKRFHNYVLINFFSSCF